MCDLPQMTCATNANTRHHSNYRRILVQRLGTRCHRSINYGWKSIGWAPLVRMSTPLVTLLVFCAYALLANDIISALNDI